MLCEMWTSQKNGKEISALLVVDMRKSLQEMMGVAQMNLKKVQNKQNKIYDKGTSNCTLNVSDKVLALLPNTQHPLKLEWRGPCESCLLLKLK